MDHPFIQEKDIRRFVTKIKKTGACWEWKGTIGNRGYGVFWHSNKNIRAHRFSFELHSKNKIPEGLFILHKCDNPPCVNPNHLFVGTNSDNMNDFVSKGGQLGGIGEKNGMHTHPECRPNGIRHGSKTHPENIARGTDLPGARLDENKVRWILRNYRPYIMTQKMMAEKFSVSVPTIRQVVKRKTWKHVHLKGGSET